MKPILLAAIGLTLVGWCGARVLAQAEEHRPEAGAAAGGNAGEVAAPHEAAAPEGAHDGGANGGAAHDGPSHAGGAHDAGPVPPARPQRWPGVLVFLILILFFMAMVIGPIVRAQAPPDLPPTHSHDEPPGASHHHGHGGTINPVPEDVAKLEQGHASDHGHGHHH